MPRSIVTCSPVATVSAPEQRLTSRAQGVHVIGSDARIMAQPAGAGATMLIFISSGSSEYRTMGSCVLCVPAICRLTPTSRPGVSSSCSSVVSTAQ